MITINKRLKFLSKLLLLESTNLGRQPGGNQDNKSDDKLDEKAPADPAEKAQVDPELLVLGFFADSCIGVRVSPDFDINRGEIVAFARNGFREFNEAVIIVAATSQLPLFFYLLYVYHGSDQNTNVREDVVGVAISFLAVLALFVDSFASHLAAHGGGTRNFFFCLEPHGNVDSCFRVVSLPLEVLVICFETIWLLRHLLVLFLHLPAVRLVPG